MQNNSHKDFSLFVVVFVVASFGYSQRWHGKMVVWGRGFIPSGGFGSGLCYCAWNTDINVFF